MKTTKLLGTIVALALTMAVGCTKDGDNYRSGFLELKTSSRFIYANTLNDTLCLTSYGPWAIKKVGTEDWCAVTQTKGYGYTSYRIPLTFTENATGNARNSTFMVEDTDHPSDAHATWNFHQLATRGDGALGNAAMVKNVTGDDGSSIDVTYDSMRRPLTLLMKKGTETLCNLTFTYSGAVTGTMTIGGTHGNMSADYVNDYQLPKSLGSSSDTIKFVEQNTFNIFTSNYAFNVVHLKGADTYKAYSFLLKSYASLAPDSIHNVDSLRYISVKGGNREELIRIKPAYGAVDNRCQSLDVNQLVLGVERCNPYMLLSLYRFARNSNVYSSLTTDNGTIGVTSQLNADKSVKRLTVTGGATLVNYDFVYY